MYIKYNTKNINIELNKVVIQFIAFLFIHGEILVEQKEILNGCLAHYPSENIFMFYESHTLSIWSSRLSINERTTERVAVYRRRLSWGDGHGMSISIGIPHMTIFSFSHDSNAKSALKKRLQGKTLSETSIARQKAKDPYPNTMPILIKLNY